MCTRPTILLLTLFLCNDVFIRIRHRNLFLGIQKIHTDLTVIPLKSAGVSATVIDATYMKQHRPGMLIGPTYIKPHGIRVSMENSVCFIGTALDSVTAHLFSILPG